MGLSGTALVRGTFAATSMETLKMDDMKRGDDAADHAPRPKQDEARKADDRQDAPNYDRATDKGQALKDEDVSSANDE